MKNLILVVLSLAFFRLPVPAQTKSAETIYEQTNDAVVRIYTYHDDNSVHGQGSGIIIKDKGIIITNHHVLGDATKIFAEHEGAYIQLDSIVAMDAQKDILILKIDKDKMAERFKSVPGIRMGNSDELKVGQRIYTIGSPYGFENTMTEGIVSGLRSSMDSSRNFIQISAPISSGSSGGAVLNAKGELIGVSTMVVSGGTAQNLNFALPINEVLRVESDQAKPPTHQESLANYYYQKGYADYITRNYQSAISNFQEAIPFAADNEQKGILYYLVGLSYQQMDRPDSALFFYNKSLDKIIRADTYMSLGELFAEKGGYERAAWYFSKAIETNPSSWEAHNNLGVIYFKQKDYVNAVKEFDASFKINSKNPNTFYMFGKIADVNQKYEIAVSFYKDAIQLNPQFADAYLALSESYLMMGDTGNAVINQQKAYQLNPNLRQHK